MAYETGTATNQTNLLGKLATFISVNMPTWSINYNGINVAEPQYYELSVSKGTTFITIIYDATVQRYQIYQSTSYNADARLKPGRPYRTSSAVASTAQYCVGETNDADAVDAYYFFSDAAENYVHVVVGITPTYFYHFGLGQSSLQAVAANANTGYCFATNWTRTPGTNQNNPWSTYNNKIGTGSYIHRSLDSGIQMAYDDGVDTKFFCNDYNGIANDAVNALPMYYGFMDSVLYYPALSLRPAFSNNTVIMPITPMCRNNISDGINRIHMTIPDIGWCNLTYNIAGDEITVGSDTWVLFPWRTKDDTAFSEEFGYAYKKIV